MDGCKDRGSDLMRYLDSEMDPASAHAFEAHLKACRACAGVVEQNKTLEEVLKSTSVAPMDEGALAEFLEGVRAGAAQAGVRRPGVPSLRIWAGLAAAAAIVFLLWAFHAGQGSGGIEESDSDSMTEQVVVKEGSEKSGISVDPSESPVSDAERLEARQELSYILAGLAETSGPELRGLFDEASADLRKRRWQVEVMLARALRREEKENLRTAIRLAKVLPAFQNVPGVAYKLSDLLKQGVYPEDTMQALAAIGGSRAEAALGKALENEAVRDLALDLLVDMGGEDAASQITKALIEKEDLSLDKLEPFACKALSSLARLGPDGVDGLLESFDESDFNPAVAAVLPALDPDLVSHLIGRLKERRGSAIQPGLILAASLRLDEAMPYLRRAADRSLGVNEFPSLMAMVGGPGAVTNLVDMYQGPVSLKVRKNLGSALAEVFAFHPDELDSTLQPVLDFLEEEGKEVLVEMLSIAGTPSSCRALSWLVENRADLACQAALGLARTGSEAALASLMEVLDRDELNPVARAAAGAAAYHLGGEEALQKVLGGQEDEGIPGRITRYPTLRGATPSRKGALTDARFQKLQALIARYTRSTEQ